MPGPALSTDALVLLARPPAESFQTLTVFSAEHGALTALQRVPKKFPPSRLVLALFDEAVLTLEGPRSGGGLWFIKEARLLARPEGIGRDYAALRRASALAALAARNPVPTESRAAVAALLRTAFAAFASGAPPDIVWLKSLWRFARDEGHPLRQQWLPSLPVAQRAEVERLLRTPLENLAGDQAVATSSADLARRLEAYLRAHAEMVLE
jgi:hypothetical protein